MAVPKKVANRISAGLTKFQEILAAAKQRDLNESDTSMIVTDMLSEIGGFDKYTEITREYAIRGTYCDIATKIDGKLQTLIEVKAVGVDLRDTHTKQAVDYAANQGVEWVVLTNGIIWKIYSVSFSKPITADLVLEIDVLELNAKDSDSVEDLFLLSKEAIQKSGLEEYSDQLKVRSKFNLAAIILSDSLLHAIRRELKRVAPDVRVSIEQIKESLTHDVLKRDVVGGDEFKEAMALIRKASKKSLRKAGAKARKDPNVLLSAESDSENQPIEEVNPS